MLRCLAIDDEPLALELLEDNISQVPFLELKGKCSNALEAMKLLNEETIDLIFLDVQMPGLTGLQFIKSLTQKPMIILVTAYEKFALQGFDLDVVDYLVKPVPLDRFIKACNKALELHSLRTKQSETTETAAPDYFFVNVDYSLLKVEFADIQWIEGLKDYIKVYTTGEDKPVLSLNSIKSLEQKLPEDKFMRVHRSFIVNLDRIDTIERSRIIFGKVYIPVSDQYKDKFQEYLDKNFL